MILVTASVCLVLSLEGILVLDSTLNNTRRVFVYLCLQNLQVVRLFLIVVCRLRICQLMLPELLSVLDLNISLLRAVK